MPNPRAIQRTEAYRRLRPMLLHGQITAGTRLGETEWAVKLGVHRGALREVLGLLAHEGLLNTGERGGHFVPTFDRNDLDEVLELRLALEVGALRCLQRRGKKMDVQPLCDTCETMRHVAESMMRLGFAEADRRFHEQLVELADNQKMIRAYLQTPVLMSVRVESTEPECRQTMRRTLDEHEAICNELVTERYDQAAVLLEEHLLTAHSAAACAPSSIDG